MDSTEAVAAGEPGAADAPGSGQDARRSSPHFVVWLLTQPGSTALVSAVIVFLFFSLTTSQFASPAGIANWLDPAATIGIISVAIALLIISGEFDLSAGIMIGSTGVVMALLGQLVHLNVWLAMLGALIFAVLVGTVNGLLVVRTRLPSFVITLAMFFALEGLNVGLTIYLVHDVAVFNLPNTIVNFDSARGLLGSTFTLFGTQFQVSLLYWIALTALGSLVLARTALGNWIQAIGGNIVGAAHMGIPVSGVKIGLFIFTAVCSWLVGMMTTLRLGSAQAGAGFDLGLQFVVAVCVGGCILTGGYGSVFGTALGALVFGMLQLGIVYARWPGQLYYLFLGIMLFVAVAANTGVRARLLRGA